MIVFFYAIYALFAFDVIHLPGLPISGRPLVGVAAGTGFLAGAGFFRRHRELL